jgi:uncharacterized protein involved in tolerance to divalent cations
MVVLHPTRENANSATSIAVKIVLEKRFTCFLLMTFSCVVVYVLTNTITQTVEIGYCKNAVKGYVYSHGREGKATL